MTIATIGSLSLLILGSFVCCYLCKKKKKAEMTLWTSQQSLDEVDDVPPQNWQTAESGEAGAGELWRDINSPSEYLSGPGLWSGLGQSDILDNVDDEEDVPSVDDGMDEDNVPMAPTAQAS